MVFLLVFAMHWIKGTNQWDTALVSHLIITAYFIAAPLNIIVNIWVLVLLIRKQQLPIEKWLLVANVLFLIIQIIYFQFT